MNQFQQNFITSVIDRYGLELDGHQIDTITATWFQRYDRAWIVKAIVESLYRGRYKIKSIDNILRDWERLGKPRYGFTPDYEREILQNLPTVTDLSTTPLSPVLSSPIDPPDTDLPVIQPALYDSKNLNPEESAPFQHHSQSVSTAQPIDAAALNLESGNDILNHSSLADNGDLDRFMMVDESGFAQSKVKSHRIVSLPVKFQLFNTLKAIIDPNNHLQAEVDRSGYSQPNSENTDRPRIATFKPPIPNISEGQHSS
ncbi:hypothetical protein [Chamaesiphon sp. VAR_48_metabat_135_sub]|uniref:hypothetical protein n=1 Tax=Chamaesiphon sp. VAR_48_metabat_135_sub TaxID=2964699 RepID=UPI00286D1225|nr:hypothetical protein [Chamaesiphon sp. VAR_48_metabat_135_sub]